MWRWAALLVLCVLTFFVGLNRQAITDADEAFYAEAGREMVASGEWVTPHFNFEPRLQKPILFYWLVAANYRIAGVGEAAARFWAALSGLGLAFIACAVAWRWSGPGPGLLAGAIAGTSLGVTMLTRMALPARLRHRSLMRPLARAALWQRLQPVPDLPPPRSSPTCKTS